MNKNKAETSLNTGSFVQIEVKEKPVFNPNDNAFKPLTSDELNDDKIAKSTNTDDAIIASNKQGLNAPTVNSIVLNKKQKKPTNNTDLAKINQAANSRSPNLAEMEAPIAEQTSTEQAPTAQAIMPIATQSEMAQRILEVVPYLPCEPLATVDPRLPELPTFVHELPPPHLRKRDFRLTAAVLGGVSFLDRKMSAKDSSFTELLDLRERSERQLEAVQAGIRLGIEHRSGLGLVTGLNYAQLNEVYRYKSSVSTLDTVNGIQYYYRNFTNDTIPVYGDIVLEQRTTHRKEIYNKYRLIEVPILVSWRHEGHQFSFGAQAGVFVNMRMTAKGRIMQTATQDVPLADLYRTNIGLSYHFGLAVGYMLNDHLEVFASPYMRYFPKNFAKANYGLEQRYALYGLNLGLGYRF